MPSLIAPGEQQMALDLWMLDQVDMNQNKLHGLGVEALVHAQKGLDFAITSQNSSLETWATYRLGCAKVLLAELDEAENLLRDSLGMNSRTANPDWDLTIELEKEIANILTTKGRVTEADEIRRRIKTLEETINGE
ncbi:MAG: hypothetical protein EBR69_01125 [Synechococcaceae bacterium WB4_2_0805]|nr:hypothetical protein [Synechococcaceae bacterium WB4_2_0805]